MKTFEQCLDEVAKKWGLPDYQTLKSQGRPDLENFYSKAAELFAREKQEEIDMMKKYYEDKLEAFQRIINSHPDEVRSKVQDAIKLARFKFTEIGTSDEYTVHEILKKLNI